MRQEIANLVHPVLAHGLHLRERLAQGEELSFETEQADILGSLLGDREARRWADFGGDDPQAMRSVEQEESRSGAFLGARYALACWLDELIILDTPWSQRWNEYKLEVRLYSSNDRAWKFWDQARLAADRPGLDALEVFYLCVMLGFTGELAEAPDQLATWIAATRSQLTRARELQWRSPPGLDPGTRVPPLRGRLALRRMLLVASLVFLTVIPAVAFFLARRMS